jgi:hypothetical protein
MVLALHSRRPRPTLALPRANRTAPAQVLVLALHSEEVPLEPFFLEAAQNLKDELVFCALSKVPRAASLFGLTLTLRPCVRA